jgi:TonB-linked SusC/RagA family outer membrane protein
VTSLQEIIVVGYGTQKKENLAGAYSSVSSKDFEQQPVTRVDQVLQGRVAGVQVINAGGAPGGDVRIRVRGANSLAGDNNPLYVVDGFVGGDFNIINPNDIQSIEVLKDASATAIYGSRGANGVIIITTKKGKKGEMKLDLGMRYYTSQLIDKWNTLNAGDFAQVSNERALASGATPKFTDAQVQEYRQSTGTDWQDEIFRSAPGVEYQLGLSGGSEKIGYLISGNVLDQDGIVNNSGFKRYTLRSNINAQLSEKLSARFILAGSRRENLNTSGTGARSGAVAQALAWAPTTPVRDADGNYILKDPTSSLFANPVALTTENESRNERTNANILTGLNYELIPGLSLDVQFGLNYTNSQDKYFAGDISPDNNRADAGRSSGEQVSWQSTNILNYKRTFNGVHSIDVTAVLEAQEERNTGFHVNVTNLTFHANRYNNLALSGSNSVGSSYSKWSLLSQVGRVNYAFKDRYLLTAAVRRDGSSKFSDANKYSVFPSVAVGWRISEEAFMRDVKVINSLKLRGSWGLTGAQAIGPYETLSRYTSNVDEAGAIFNGKNQNTIINGIALDKPGNANLKWETTAQMDIGADIELLEGKVSFSVDYFRKTTTDLHMSRSLPGYVGGSSIQSNIGTNENTGFEFVLGATPVNAPDFSWSTSFNLGLLKNKIKNLGTDRDTIPLDNADAVLITGQSMSSIWGYKFLGTYKPHQADEAALYGRTPGDAQYEDVNGDGVISASDYQVIGNGIPRASLGFNNTFTYKNLSLNLFFQGIFGFDKLNYTYAYGMVGGTDVREIMFEDVKGRYIPGVNETSNVPKFGGHSTNSEMLTSRFVEKGDFLRLKNVSLAYTIPKSTLRNIADVRLFASATNLLTFTNYKGIDPESSSSAVNGLTWDNVNTDTAMALDFGSYPNAKTYTVGFNITF